MNNFLPNNFGDNGLYQPFNQPNHLGICSIGDKNSLLPYSNMISPPPQHETSLDFVVHHQPHSVHHSFPQQILPHNDSSNTPHNKSSNLQLSTQSFIPHQEQMDHSQHVQFNHNDVGNINNPPSPRNYKQSPSNHFHLTPPSIASIQSGQSGPMNNNHTALNQQNNMNHTNQSNNKNKPNSTPKNQHSGNIKHALHNNAINYSAKMTSGQLSDLSHNKSFQSIESLNNRHNNGLNSQNNINMNQNHESGLNQPNNHSNGMNNSQQSQNNSTVPSSIHSINQIQLSQTLPQSILQPSHHLLQPHPFCPHGSAILPPPPFEQDLLRIQQEHMLLSIEHQKLQHQQLSLVNILISREQQINDLTGGNQIGSGFRMDESAWTSLKSLEQWKSTISVNFEQNMRDITLYHGLIDAIDIRVSELAQKLTKTTEIMQMLVHKNELSVQSNQNFETATPNHATTLHEFTNSTINLNTQLKQQNNDCDVFNKDSENQFSAKLSSFEFLAQSISAQQAELFSRLLVLKNQQESTSTMLTEKFAKYDALLAQNEQLILSVHNTTPQPPKDTQKHANLIENLTLRFEKMEKTVNNNFEQQANKFNKELKTISNTLNAELQRVTKEFHTDMNKMGERITVLSRTVDEQSKKIMSLTNENDQLKTSLSKQKSAHSLLSDRFDQLHTIIKKEKEKQLVIHNAYQTQVKASADFMERIAGEIQVIHTTASNTSLVLDKSISQLTSTLAHDQAFLLLLLKKQHFAASQNLHDRLLGLTAQQVRNIFTKHEIVITQQQFQKYLDYIWFITDFSTPSPSMSTAPDITAIPANNSNALTTPLNNHPNSLYNNKIIQCLHRSQSPKIKMAHLSTTYWSGKNASSLPNSIQTTPIEYLLFLLHVYYNVAYYDHNDILFTLFSRVGIPYRDVNRNLSYLYLSHIHTNTKTTYTQHSLNDLIENICSHSPINAFLLRPTPQRPSTDQNMLELQKAHNLATKFITSFQLPNVLAEGVFFSSFYDLSHAQKTMLALNKTISFSKYAHNLHPIRAGREGATINVSPPVLVPGSPEEPLLKDHASVETYSQDNKHSNLESLHEAILGQTMQGIEIYQEFAYKYQKTQNNVKNNEKSTNNPENKKESNENSPQPPKNFSNLFDMLLPMPNSLNQLPPSVSAMAVPLIGQLAVAAQAAATISDSNACRGKNGVIIEEVIEHNKINDVSTITAASPPIHGVSLDKYHMRDAHHIADNHDDGNGLGYDSDDDYDARYTKEYKPKNITETISFPQIPPPMTANPSLATTLLPKIKIEEVLTLNDKKDIEDKTALRHKQTPGPQAFQHFYSSTQLSQHQVNLLQQQQLYYNAQYSNSYPYNTLQINPSNCPNHPPTLFSTVYGPIQQSHLTPETLQNPHHHDFSRKYKFFNNTANVAQVDLLSPILTSPAHADHCNNLYYDEYICQHLTDGVHFIPPTRNHILPFPPQSQLFREEIANDDPSDFENAASPAPHIVPPPISINPSQHAPFDITYGEHNDNDANNDYKMHYGRGKNPTDNTSLSIVKGLHDVYVFKDTPEQLQHSGSSHQPTQIPSPNISDTPSNNNKRTILHQSLVDEICNGSERNGKTTNTRALFTSTTQTLHPLQQHHMHGPVPVLNTASYLATQWFQALIKIFRFICVLSRSYCTRQEPQLSSEFPSIMHVFLLHMVRKPFSKVTFFDIYYLTLYWAVRLYMDSFTPSFSQQHPVCNSIFDCFDENDPDIRDVFTFLNTPLFLELTNCASEWDQYKQSFDEVLTQQIFVLEKMSDSKRSFVKNGMAKVSIMHFSAPLYHRISPGFGIIPPGVVHPVYGTAEQNIPNPTIAKSIHYESRNSPELAGWAVTVPSTGLYHGYQQPTQQQFLHLQQEQKQQMYTQAKSIPQRQQKQSCSNTPINNPSPSAIPQDRHGDDCGLTEVDKNSGDSFALDKLSGTGSITFEGVDLTKKFTADELVLLQKTQHQSTLMPIPTTIPPTTKQQQPQAKKGKKYKK